MRGTKQERLVTIVRHLLRHSRGKPIQQATTTERHMRALDSADAGDVIEVSSPLEELARTLPDVMKDLGYQEGHGGAARGCVIVRLPYPSSLTMTLPRCTPARSSSWAVMAR